MKKRIILAMAACLSLCVISCGKKMDAPLDSGANVSQGQTAPTDGNLENGASASTGESNKTSGENGSGGTAMNVSTQETVIFLEEADVAYEALSFSDSVELTASKGAGWLVDLDGDGTEERLYADGQGIFVNGILQIPDGEAYDTASDFAGKFWLLDIDTTDGQVELLTYTGLDYSLWYCGGGETLAVQRNICSWADLYHQTFEEAEDLRHPMRVDEHTVSFVTFSDMPFDRGSLRMEYRFDENHRLVRIQKEYEMSAMAFAYLNEERPLRLYAERNLDGAYEEFAAPRVFLHTMTDGAEWEYFESAQYDLRGWFYVGEDADSINGEGWMDSFIGYSDAS